MEPTLISVLMVSYNSEKHIKDAIESVLSQTYQNFELIICDDNSTDNTWQIIDSYQDKRIRKYKNDKNLKEYPNRNKAISLAQGDYLIFIDADDIIYSYGLEFLIQFTIKYPDCGMIIAREWDERIIYPKQISSYQFFCFEYLDSGICGINFTKVLFKASVFQQSEPFKNGLKLGDIYLQYKLALNNNSVIIPDAATWWRRSSGQASESLLKDYAYYLKHEMWIKLEMLQQKDCPLNKEEKEIAYHNIYGNYLRSIFRLLVQFKLKSIRSLSKKYSVPSKYWVSIFKRQKRNYFRSISGNQPLEDRVNKHV